jgi:hypothetical protein
MLLRAFLFAVLINLKGFGHSYELSKLKRVLSFRILNFNALLIMLSMLLVEEVDSASTAYDLYAGGAKFIGRLSQYSTLYSSGVRLDRLRESHFKGQLTQYQWINQIKYLS